MALSITPLADRVIVRPAAAETKTKSGIIIPDTAQEKPQHGEVVAVGEGKIDNNGSVISPRVKVGDKVIHEKVEKFAPNIKEITVDGEQYLIMRESDILAVITA